MYVYVCLFQFRSALYKLCQQRQTNQTNSNTPRIKANNRKSQGLWLGDFQLGLAIEAVTAKAV